MELANWIRLQAGWTCILMTALHIYIENLKSESSSNKKNIDGLTLNVDQFFFLLDLLGFETFALCLPAGGLQRSWCIFYKVYKTMFVV